MLLPPPHSALQHGQGGGKLCCTSGCCLAGDAMQRCLLWMKPYRSLTLAQAPLPSGCSLSQAWLHHPRTAGNPSRKFTGCTTATQQAGRGVCRGSRLSTVKSGIPCSPKALPGLGRPWQTDAASRNITDLGMGKELQAWQRGAESIITGLENTATVLAAPSSVSGTGPRRPNQISWPLAPAGPGQINRHAHKPLASSCTTCRSVSCARAGVDPGSRDVNKRARPVQKPCACQLKSYNLPFPK